MIYHEKNTSIKGRVKAFNCRYKNEYLRIKKNEKVHIYKKQKKRRKRKRKFIKKIAMSAYFNKLQLEIKMKRLV